MSLLTDEGGIKNKNKTNTKKFQQKQKLGESPTIIVTSGFQAFENH